MASIRRIFARFIDLDRAHVVNNADWLDGLAYIPFLRDIGRHFSVNRMLSFDSVRLRLDREQPLSFLEFNYMILQAYDFLELGRRLDCRLQMGGSDQWGNIVNGVELNRRVDGRETYGLTTPLITTADGGKMGKTAAGAVWLHEDHLPAWEYWQYWRNTDDRDVGRFLRLFTDLPDDEIARLEQLEGAEINAAKIALADAATALCRGTDAAREAHVTAASTFGGGGGGGALPSHAAPGPMPLLDVLVALGLAASKGEGRRLVKQGGVRVGDAVVSDELLQVIPTPGGTKVSAGKKRHGLLVLSA